MKTIKSARLTRIVVLAMVICMALSLLPATALAANTAVNEAKNGVVQVRVTYFNDLNQPMDLFSGTGFLVNDNTVLTCNHVVTMSVTDMEVLAAEVGKTVPEFQSRLKIRITVSRDVTVDAAVIKASEEMDFAILRLNESLRGKKSLAIRSSDTVQQTEHVYSIGYPDISSSSQSFNTYTSDDATITEGVVNKNGAYFGSNTNYLQTSCNLDNGNSGGPMVDENGYVVGISAGYIGDDATEYYYAVAIDQVVEILTSLGIPFTSADAVVVEPPVVDEPPVVTDPPVVDEPVQQDPQPSVALPPLDVPDGSDNVAKDDGPDLTMILIIAAVAVAVIVVIVVVVVAGGKKKKPAPVPPAPVPPVPPRPSFEAGSTTPIQGAGETTVLNGGSAGETTVLNQNVNGGMLIRKRTGENVKVNAESFVIGREPRDVNYCISDNTAVSRVHAKLTVRGGTVYLTSMTDKNGTFVNNTKVLRNQEVALKNGDRITLANEELEYRI